MSNNPTPVKIQGNNGLIIAALHFTPANGSIDRKGAAIVISHPMTGVKEQTSSTYADFLAKQGFHTVAFDATFQGESTGEPRGLENPPQRAEDVKNVVTYLTTIKGVNSEKIGLLGICASGGYTSYATQADGRIKALVTVSAVCVGRMMRSGGVHPNTPENSEAIQALHQAAGQWRNLDIQKQNPPTQPAFDVDIKNQKSQSDSFYRDASEYYGTKRGNHPRSDQKMPAISYDHMLPYDSFNFQHLISPRPLLMIAGEDAQTLHYSQTAIELAKEPKELIIIPKRNHFDLYDDLTVTGPKSTEFFAKALA